MKYDTFKKYIKRSGLTIKEFAELIKYNPSSISNLKNQEVPNNLAIIAVLLAELEYNECDYKKALEKIDIEPKEGFFKKEFGGKQCYQKL